MMRPRAFIPAAVVAGLLCASPVLAQPSYQTRLPLEGKFTAPGESRVFVPLPGAEFNVSLWGEFRGLVQLERRFPGTPWLPVTAEEWGAPTSGHTAEPEPRVSYRLRAVALSAGAASYRVSQ